jgi:hypothetical protein
VTIPMCGGESALNYFQLLTSSIGQHPTNKYATNVAYLYLKIFNELFGDQGAFAVGQHIKAAGLIIDEVGHDITG